MDAKEVNIHARCHAEMERLDRTYQEQIARQKKAIDRFLDYLNETNQMPLFHTWMEKQEASD